jgi:hypothetical protein
VAFAPSTISGTSAPGPTTASVMPLVSFVIIGRPMAGGLGSSHSDGLAFAFSESVAEPSGWNTLRALRVLWWYERAGR